MGAYSAPKITTGDYNVSVGYISLETNTTGNYNTYTGSSNGSTANNFSNNSVYGYNVYATSSNGIWIGNNSNMAIQTRVETIGIGTTNVATMFGGIYHNIYTKSGDGYFRIDDVSGAKGTRWAYFQWDAGGVVTAVGTAGAAVNFIGVGSTTDWTKDSTYVYTRGTGLYINNGSNTGVQLKSRLNY
jgi:hypothetical protein